VVAEPWPGAVGIWSSSQDSGYELNRLVAASAVVGLTESPLLKASPGLWDRGTPLRIRISGGELASVDLLSVLNGANAMAIGDGSAGRWEVLQFADAQIVAPETYEVSMRLRGQLGTDGLMPDLWPIGSTVVLLDLALVQIDMPLSAIGLARHYRIGGAARGSDDVNATHRIEAIDGVGLRPYPVSHLLANADVSGDLTVTWKRRTRIGGDIWQAPDVPLGEESEAYSVRIVQALAVIAEYGSGQTKFNYTSAMRAADGVVGSYEVEVAQLSAQVGPGPFRSVTVPS